MEEADRILLVTMPFIPDEARPAIEIIGAIPIDAISQWRRATGAPSHFANGRPGATQLQVAMKVGLVHVQQNDLFSTNLFIQFGKSLNEAGALGRVGLLQQLLTLLPTQPLLFQQGAQGGAAHRALPNLGQPMLQFLQVPVVARLAMVGRHCPFHRLGDFIDLLRRKRGARPPVRRYTRVSGPAVLYVWTQPNTVSSVLPTSAAHCAALLCPLAIMYRARKRSRLRGWSASMDRRRKSATVWFHLATFGRIITNSMKSLIGNPSIFTTLGSSKPECPGFYAFSL